MKTTEQKAIEIMDKIFCLDLTTVNDFGKVKVILMLALKEQDRDTRHACVESYNKYVSETLPSDWADVDASHVILNTRLE